MKSVVSNSGPLFHLTKVGLIGLLLKLFDKIYIPPSVYEEIVIKGNERGHSDAKLIENQISNENIIVKDIKKDPKNFQSSRLHPGELDAIELALNLNTNLILLDDEEARIFARTLQLKVKGSLGILVQLLKEDYLKFNEAEHYLRKLNSIMYLSSDAFNYIRDQFRKYKIIDD